MDPICTCWTSNDSRHSAKCERATTGRIGYCDRATVRNPYTYNTRKSGYPSPRTSVRLPPVAHWNTVRFIASCQFLVRQKASFVEQDGQFYTITHGQVQGVYSCEEPTIDINEALLLGTRCIVPHCWLDAAPTDNYPALAAHVLFETHQELAATISRFRPALDQLLCRPVGHRSA